MTALRGVRTPRLGHAGRQRALAVSGGAAPGGEVHGRAHALHVDQGIGQHVLDRLEGADRLAELDPVLGVLDGHPEHPVGRSEHLCADQGGRTVEGLGGRVATSEAPGRGAVETQDPELTGAVHGREGVGAWGGALVDGEHVGVGDDDGQVGRRRIGGRWGHAAQEHLVAVAIAVADGSAVIAGAGQASDAGHGLALAQRFAPLLGPADGERIGRTQRAQRHDRGEEGDGGQTAPDLLAQHGGLDQAHPEAALVLGDLEGQPTLLGHGRPGGGVVAGRGVGDGGAGAVAPPAPGSVPTTAPGPTRARNASWPAIRSNSVTAASRESLLVAREVEVHGGAVYGQR